MLAESHMSPPNHVSGGSHGFTRMWVQVVRQDTLGVYPFSPKDIWVQNVGYLHEPTFFKSIYTWVRRIWATSSQLTCFGCKDEKGGETLFQLNFTVSKCKDKFL